MREGSVFQRLYSTPTIASHNNRWNVFNKLEKTRKNPEKNWGVDKKTRERIRNTSSAPSIGTRPRRIRSKTDATKKKERKAPSSSPSSSTKPSDSNNRRPLLKSKKSVVPTQSNAKRSAAADAKLLSKLAVINPKIGVNDDDLQKQLDDVLNGEEEPQLDNVLKDEKKEEFENLLSTIQKQTPPTLVLWRLSNEKIFKVLKDFACSSDKNDRNFEILLPQTQVLFNHLNSRLAEQERDNRYFSSTLSNLNSPRNDEFSVVFGGKYVTKPVSISGNLVSRLLKDNAFIYTVSRSKPHDNAPKNLIHMQSKNLTDDKLGKEEFLKVLNMARDKWEKSFPKTKMVLYFTLGFYKGETSCETNLVTARNFQEALVESFTDLDKKHWRVVVTGTDATRPNTSKGDTFDWKKDDTNNSESKKLVIPSYKLDRHNYFYALSKLGQFYIIASAVAQLTSATQKVKPTNEKFEPTIKKIEKYVELFKTGCKTFDLLVKYSSINNLVNPLNGAHPKPSLETDKTEENVLETHANMLIAGLDDISKSFDHIMEEEFFLRDYFMVAKGISICYTPLHATPWTEEAVKSTSCPRLFILKQLIPRLKNAISIEQAVALHFPLESTGHK
eukprot:CAMPEP_0194169034 /NCGR_PEP_ID=MMETSP0154-20130528/3752_1 /TAXON_ID=1049557 /ORGANISM="Thalassiothrix antarctica, Strain L6-D1" /LENGTH=613 /DNA_ID=CAMNT_0038880265 /DNA_START=78 /DNA_END=1919 /DNA_ORIENTATION=+